MLTPEGNRSAPQARQSHSQSSISQTNRHQIIGPSIAAFTYSYYGKLQLSISSICVCVCVHRSHSKRFLITLPRSRVIAAHEHLSTWFAIGLCAIINSLPALASVLAFRLCSSRRMTSTFPGIHVMPQWQFPSIQSKAISHSISIIITECNQC